MENIENELGVIALDRTRGSFRYTVGAIALIDLVGFGGLNRLGCAGVEANITLAAAASLVGCITSDFLFSNVAVAGLKLHSWANWKHFRRFITTCVAAVLGYLLVSIGDGETDVHSWIIADFEKPAAIAFLLGFLAGAPIS